MKKRNPWDGNSVGGYHGNETRVEYPDIGLAENGKLKGNETSAEHPAIGYVENGKLNTYETSGEYDVTALQPKSIHL